MSDLLLELAGIEGRQGKDAALEYASEQLERLFCECNEHKSNAMSAEYREAELIKVLETQSCEITKYREWFKENATNLAVHRIGGYEFVDFPDPVSEELPANVDK